MLTDSRKFKTRKMNTCIICMIFFFFSFLLYSYHGFLLIRYAMNFKRQILQSTLQLISQICSLDLNKTVIQYIHRLLMRNNDLVRGFDKEFDKEFELKCWVKLNIYSFMYNFLSFHTWNSVENYGMTKSKRSHFLIMCFKVLHFETNWSYRWIILFKAIEVWIQILCKRKQLQ